MQVTLELRPAEREQRTKKLVAALRQDMRDSAAVEQTFDQAVGAALTAFKVARERGETPPPVYFRFSGSDTPPQSPCQGALQAQIAELMDPELLWEVCFYYDERDGTAQKVRAPCGVHGKGAYAET